MTGRQIPVITFFQSPTIEQLADKIRKGECTGQTSSPMQVNTGATKMPLFWVHDTFLAGHLEPDQPLYVVHPSIHDKELSSRNTIEGIAANSAGSAEYSTERAVSSQAAIASGRS